MREGGPAAGSVFVFTPTWSLLALSRKESEHPSVFFYLYTEHYYFNFTFSLAGSSIRINGDTNSVSLLHPIYSPNYRHYLGSLREVFRSITSVFFYKLKFRGKGYYVYKNSRNTIAPQFGYYHRVYVYAHSVSVKFLSKTSVLLFGLSKRDLLTVGYDFRSKKPVNIFTGRGVRFARQVIYKKTGKVSSYR
jgi:hypothetical protein